MSLGLKKQAELCHQLAMMLEAGVPMMPSLRSLQRHGVSRATRPLVGRIADQIESGAGLTKAIEEQGQALPPLIRHLVQAGERSGNLPAVLRRLGEHYEFRRLQRRNLLFRLAYPAAVVFMAILVASILAYVATMTAEKMGTPGGGGSPESAFLRTFFTGLGFVGLGVGAVLVLIKVLPGVRAVQEVLVRLPFVGAIPRNLALAQFSWSMELMLRAGMNVQEALSRSLEATANGAFVARRERIYQAIAGGFSVTEALARAGLFPEGYCTILSVGEQSGNMEQSFGRLAQQHFERAETATRVTASAIGWAIWGAVALYVAIFVISFYMRFYGNLLSGGIGT